MAKRGIDISAHQGNIDLAALKNQIDFVIIRVGYGTNGTLDTKFKRNADLCKSLGIPFGFYWYSYALDENGARKEAEACINAIAPYKDFYTMGVWFDMEDADSYKKKNGMPSNGTLRAICRKFCLMLEEAGYYAGIYASQSWFKNQLNGSELDRFDKWVAQWPTNSSGNQKGLDTDANSRSDLSMWQFTSMGQFSGYNGRLDVDYAYKDSYRVGEAAAAPEVRPAETTITLEGSTLDLAVGVMQGKYGDGNDRVKNLGTRYDEVQDFINHIYSADINTLVSETKAGKYGNGETRKIILGSRYNDVQDAINNESNKEVTYTVQKGDTLSSIAKKYNTTWNKIYNDNKATIGSNPNKIYVGQKLIIK